jgi:hypothetical protein
VKNKLVVLTSAVERMWGMRNKLEVYGGLKANKGAGSMCKENYSLGSRINKAVSLSLSHTHPHTHAGMYVQPVRAQLAI